MTKWSITEHCCQRYAHLPVIFRGPHSLPLCGRQLYYVVALDQSKLAFMYLPVILSNGFSPYYLYFSLQTKIMIHFQQLYIRTRNWINVFFFLEISFKVHFHFFFLFPSWFLIKSWLKIYYYFIFKYTRGKLTETCLSKLTNLVKYQKTKQIVDNHSTIFNSIISSMKDFTTIKLMFSLFIKCIVVKLFDPTLIRTH